METRTHGAGVTRLVPIMPAPPVESSSVSYHDAPVDPTTTMPFNCQACVRKKIKCDRRQNTCLRCRRSKLPCVYKAPPPRRARRQHQKPEEHQHAPCLKASPDSIWSISPNTDVMSTSTQPSESLTPKSAVMLTKSGKLITGDRQTQYIDNVMLLEDGNTDLCDVSDSGEEDGGGSEEPLPEEGTPTSLLGLLTTYALPGDNIGAAKGLVEHYPSHEELMKLWNIFATNVDPLCKILHIPTMTIMMNTISRDPDTASRDDACLLFSISHFAVLTMTDSSCKHEFGVYRNELVSKYRMAFCQALINASWLRTKSLTVLQAYVLFLVAMRSQIDADTFWVLTGIAVRLAQRMGLHRDSEALGLPPFEVQLRRRIFWQILPLDAYAGQVSGSGISISPDSWDTHTPQNINDEQIFPGMIEKPQEQTRATEMIFCLARMELSNFYTRTGVQMKQGGSIQFKEAEDVEKLISEVESTIETKYLRYCDILNPLHFITTGIVRSAINAIRLRTRMPPLIAETMADAQRKEMCVLAQNILDTNSAIYNNPNVQNFLWQMRTFFLWDAVLCVLLSLLKPGFFSISEVNLVWDKLTQVYRNYEALTKGRKSLHVAIGKITLKAWMLNPKTNALAEPVFITDLRSREQAKLDKRQARSASANHDEVVFDLTSVVDPIVSMESIILDLDADMGFTDWTSWDQLCHGTDTN